jgi:hypothetical protein
MSAKITKPARKAKADAIDSHFQHTRKYFCVGEFELPVAGLPAPVPCPFCGQTDVRLEVERDEGKPTCSAECARCGMRAAFAIFDDESGIVSSYEVIRESARLWNKRTPPKEAQAD